ncbi:beta-ribofuranosylaminobenzene 5'-phosphate synthase family protein [Ramlibacter sp. AN1133]|uniref:beta-ribofuranosylaminobenzene 5'-phosphate synthase family protein n=1 Tax=Ramlibacter sp. AN1133 TaxID=3133429 RepID=UPI0030BD4D91
MHSAFDTRVAAARRAWPFGRVRVQAPARLHLGFLDPAGTLGRRFGSLGLVIDGPQTLVDIGRAESDSFEGLAGGAALERARGHVETLRRATGCHTPLVLRLRSALPAHAGLGSGTQLALAVGRAFCAAFDVPITTPQLAFVLGRGARSGVGVAGFDLGGLLLDGGPRADGSPAALLARIALPDEWRVLLVLDPRAEGLSGAQEKAALARIAPLPRTAAAEICHEVLLRVLPGAAGAEFAPFAAGLTRMQQLLGEHFAPAQEGRAFTSEAVGRLLHWIARNTETGIGQSSWGPTGFAFLPSESQAHALLAAARAAGVVDPALEVQVIRARNHGAVVADQRAGG